MKDRLKRMAGGVLRRAGLRRPPAPPAEDPHDREFRDLPGWVREIMGRVAPYTMTGPRRVASVCAAAEYAVKHEISGAFVECGVWRGGSVMAMLLTLEHLGAEPRDVHLFDTFEGMPEPGEADRDLEGRSAAGRSRTEGGADGWLRCGTDAVRANLETTGCDLARVHLVEGKVEDTLSEHAPAEIALLRLDTDWYGSTRRELEVLYPRLNVGGVLIVDDYGHWEGARRAVDEYLAAHEIRLYLHRVDYTGRTAVKQHP